MTSIDLESDEYRPKRRSNDNVVDRVAVRDALKGVVKGMDALQREAVFLRAQISRSLANPETFIPRIVALGQNVGSVSAEFEGVVESLLYRQRDHGRVGDIRRALDALKTSVPRLPS